MSATEARRGGRSTACQPPPRRFACPFMKGHNTFRGSIGAFAENGPQITLGLPGAAGGKFTFWGRASYSHQTQHLQKIQARYLTSDTYRRLSLPSSAWGRQPSLYLEFGGPAVEGMRLKPDAILPQTDGHRKPPRSELSPPLLEPLHAGGTTGSPKLPEEERKLPSEFVSRAFKQTQRPIRVCKILVELFQQRDSRGECFAPSGQTVRSHSETDQIYNVHLN